MTKSGLNFGLVITFVTHYLSYVLDNIFSIVGTKFRRQTVGITMRTNCVPLVADSFLFCYE